MTEALDIADSTLPTFSFADGGKRTYLSFRLTGFSKAEARQYAKIAPRTLAHWIATDTEFNRIEKGDLNELRKQFAKEILEIEHTRNFKLALEKDHKILRKAVSHPRNMTKDDTDYLLKIRPLYTPQQAAALDSLFKDRDTGLESFDEILLLARRTHGQAQSSANQTTGRYEEYQESPALPSGSARGEEED